MPKQIDKNIRIFTNPILYKPFLLLYNESVRDYNKSLNTVHNTAKRSKKMEEITMSVKVAINGFGRIGRLAFRQMFGAEGFEVVAINELNSHKILYQLLK